MKRLYRYFESRVEVQRIKVRKGQTIGLTVTRRVIEALQCLPEGICLCGTWLGENEAWCIWEGTTCEAGEQVQKFLREKFLR